MFRKLTKNVAVRIVLAALALILIVLVVAQITAKRAVANFLDRKLPQHVQLEYGNIDANVLRGSVGLQDISLNFYNRDSMILNTKMYMDALSLAGLGYWDFLFNAKISVERLRLQKPRIHYYPYRIVSSTEKEPEGVVQLLKRIAIQELSVENGSLDILQDQIDSTALVLKHININIRDASTGPDQITEKIPVKYGAYNLNADSLYLNLGAYEKLDVTTLLWNTAGAKITGLQLQSKYEKAKLASHLFEERDYVNLQIPIMQLDSIRFGYKKNVFFINTGNGAIQEPTLELYRDKLVADDIEKPKKLYGRHLRELPIYLNVPEIDLMNGKVVYSERIADVSDPGKLSFEMLNANLKNISNTYARGATTIVKAKAKFMGTANMSLDWSFDINRTNDAFFAAGSVTGFDTERINPFLKSNARALASGYIDELYFTIDGNATSSSGTMKMKYKDFKFQVLNRDRLRTNKVLTAIGNIFVDDGSKSDANGYRYGHIEAKRDVTKSFFSYLWSNVRNGTLSTLTGNGEKK